MERKTTSAKLQHIDHETDATLGPDGLPRLYKYRPLAPCERREQTLAILREGEVYFARPSQFADHEDCRPKLSLSATQAEKRAAYRRYLQDTQGLTRSQAQQETERFFRSMGRAGLRQWEQERRASYEEWLTEGIGVFCVCEVNDSVRMWREYAADHNGICIELKPTKAPPEDYGHVEFFGQLLKVQYQDRAGVVDVYRMRRCRQTLDLDCVIQAVVTKTRRWEHEREWRYVDMKRGPGKRPLPQGLISGVILGHAVSDADCTLVSQLAAALTPPATVSRAELNAEGSGVSLVPLATC